MVIRSAIREVLRRHQASENPLVRYGVGGSRWAHRVVRSWASADYRAVMRAKVFSSRRLHQTTTLTWMDRYPGVFAACRDHLGDRPGLNVLSFGCSTGDEALTLRGYFPQATIVGAEINRRCLAVCRRQIVDDRTSFIL
ncbi:MAG: hypothetical protein M3083_24890 [Actinomycetota bacterium]|nr:hypothetical protein [Actinomycetota bacterium]MDQ6945877.1 hypothetical protein [Actinomycetota bacterium]